jgi:hypothetical protein
MRTSWNALLGVIALAALSGCNNSVTAPTPPENPMPLKIGDHWQYTGGVADSVIGTVLSDGHEWARVQGTFLGHELVRMNDQHQFVVLFPDATPPTEGVLFDFDLPAKSHWVFQTGQDGKPTTVELVSYDDTITTPAGTYDHCYTFFLDVPGQVGADLTYVVAPDVGIVYRSSMDGVTNALQSFYEKEP